MVIKDTGQIFTTHFREIDWNGIPAYEISVMPQRQECEERDHLEQYFQNMLKNLPGGVAVVRYEEDGSMVPW